MHLLQRQLEDKVQEVQQAVQAGMLNLEAEAVRVESLMV